MRIILSAIIFLCASVNVFSAETGSIQERHPGDVALLKKEDGSMGYVSFPAGDRLFVNDGDSPGKSYCYRGCMSAWPPLYVSDDNSSQSIGDWSVIVRDDGKKQWAYKGQPVYRRYHDLREEIDEGSFHLLVP